MDNGILIIGIAAIMYLVIVFFISLYYLIKNYDKKPEYCEKDDKIHIGVYESGTKNFRTYREFIFAKIDGEYFLDKEFKKRYIKNIVTGILIAMILLMIPVSAVLVVENARIAFPGMVVAISVIITIAIEFEVYQYIKCIKFLRKMD